MHTEHRYLNTNRGNEHERRQIADRLNRDDRGGGNRRQHLRFLYQVAQGLEIQIDQPGGSRAYFIVHPRNISAGGMAFLHGNFMYPGTKCLVKLRTRDGEFISVRCTIMRCHCVEGMTHDVGAKFDQPIDIDDFVAADSTAACQPIGDAKAAKPAAMPPIAADQLAGQLRELAGKDLPSDDLRQALLAWAQSLQPSETIDC